MHRFLPPMSNEEKEKLIKEIKAQLQGLLEILNYRWYYWKGKRYLQINFKTLMGKCIDDLTLSLLDDIIAIRPYYIMCTSRYGYYNLYIYAEELIFLFKS